MALAERILAPIAHFRDRFQAARLQVAHDGVIEHTPQPVMAPVPNAHTIKDGLTIPCPDPTAEERARDMHQSCGQKLARNEDWDKLIDEVTDADAKRLKTPGGMPIAELLAYGARSDVVGAVEHALLGGRPAIDAPLMAGIEALEHVLAEHPDSPALAAIVAMTHIDLGWAWRGTGWKIEVPERNKEAFSAHFDRAVNIMSTFDAITYDSPLLAATHCALAPGRTEAASDVAQRFDTWIDLDPKNPQAYRAFGARMLPRCHGSYDQLELAARRTAGRTHDVWGAGAYTWVMLDAISSDPHACVRVDLEFFMDGLDDILSYAGDQHTVNLLLAYCANTMGATQTGDNETDLVRTQIAAAADWIARDHLTELHPMLWAHAARGFDNACLINSGGFRGIGSHCPPRHLWRAMAAVGS